MQGRQGRLTVFIPSDRLDRRGKPAPLPGANELISTSRAGWRYAARVKKEETERVAKIVRQAMRAQGWKRPEHNRVKLHMVWVEVNRRRDQDNIRAYEKPLLDGIVRAGALLDDSQRCIEGCSVHDLDIDPQRPGVRVIVDIV